MMDSKRDFAVFDQLPVGIFVLGFNGILHAWNTRLEEWTGLSRQTIVGQPVTTHFPQLTSPPYAARLETIFQGGPPVIFSSQLHGHIIPAYRADGSRLTQFITVSAISATNGLDFDALFTVQDVSERSFQVQSTRRMHNQTLKLMQERQEAEALTNRLGRILDESFNEIYIFDAKTLYFLQANRGAQHNSGYSLEELKGMTPLDLKRDYDQEAFETLLLPLRTGELDRIHFKTIHQRKDGSQYPAEVHLSLSSSENPPVFVAIVQDITDRKRGEEALQKRTHALERANAFLAALGKVATQLQHTLELNQILHLLGDEMAKLGFHYVIAYTTPDEKALEIQHTSLSPKALSVLKKLGIHVLGYRLTSQNMPPFADLIEKCQAVYIPPEETIAGVLDALPLFTRAAARQATKLISISTSTASFALPLMSRGKVIGALIFWGGNLEKTDVSIVQAFTNQVATAIENARLYRQADDALQQANNELVRVNQQLRVALATKSAFLQCISHELRTPLNAIIGFTNLLQRNQNGEDREKRVRYVANIHKASVHLLSMVNTILDATALEAGDITLKRSPVRIGDAITNAISRIEDLAQKQGIRLSSQIEDPDLVIMADPERLAQILNHLMDNAVKFIPESGEVSVKCEVVEAVNDEESLLPAQALRHMSAGRQLLISVTDTGIGIDPQDYNKIFALFEQVKNPLTRTQDGSGLGLALARGLVELHGGQIWFKSHPGKGTTFFVALPFLSSDRHSPPNALTADIRPSQPSRER